MSTSRLHWCLHDKQFVPGTSSWRLRLPVSWRLSLQGRKALQFWPWKWKWTRWRTWHRKPKVSSVGFIISLFFWAGAAGIYGRIALGKFLSNLSVCFLHCPCGTRDRHETCVEWSNITTLFGWMVLCATMLVMRSSPHLRLLRECSPGPGPCVLNGWKDWKRAPPSTQYEFSCMTIQQLESKSRQATGLKTSHLIPRHGHNLLHRMLQWVTVKIENKRLHCFFLVGPCLLPFILVELLACTIVWLVRAIAIVLRAILALCASQATEVGLNVTQS